VKKKKKRLFLNKERNRKSLPNTSSLDLKTSLGLQHDKCFSFSFGIGPHPSLKKSAK